MRDATVKRLLSIRPANLPTIFGHKLISLFSSFFQGTVVYNYDAKRQKIIKLLKNTKAENEMLLEDIEALQLFLAVKNIHKIKGDIAEVGCYKGGSSKIICEAKGNRKFHLFDTFNGLPNPSKDDDPQQFFSGQFLSSLDHVKNYLKRYPNLFFHKGLFPKTANPIKNIQFSFIHLDLDIYQSTIDALRFFYPRLNRGGVILSHDYINAPGVFKAFNQFFRHKPELIIELPSSQCLVVKL